MIQQLILERRKIFLVRIIIPEFYLESTSVITNETGGVVEETFYAPYGQILSGGEVSRYSYEGKELSPSTDDYDFHFRKFDPNLMIFTKPDAGVKNVYDPQSLNRYSFERRNPYKYVDPNGKEIVLATIAGVAITYTVVEMAIDIISLSYSAYSYREDPRSVVNTVALSMDVIDIFSGPFSNPGPSGIAVHTTSFYWKQIGKHTAAKAGIGIGAYFPHDIEKNYFSTSNTNPLVTRNYNDYGENSFNVPTFSSNNFLNNNLRSYNQINQAQQVSSGSGGGCMCTAPSTISTSSNSQGSTSAGSGSSSSWWEGAKQKASNAWNSLTNFIGGLF